MAKYTIKNFWVNCGDIEAKTKEEAEKEFTKAILMGEFELEVKEAEG